MTSTDVAVRETHQTTVLSNEHLSYIAKTEFVPAGLRGNLPAILACVATGRALGIDDMTAIRSIHVIDGKATFSAELMVQLVRRAGHSITGEFTDGSSTVVGTRADNGDTMTVTWTMAMADRAGLASKSNWRKYPESMLWARAVSQLCRMLFPDCFAGSTYTPEEMGDEGTLSEPGVDESGASHDAGDQAASGSESAVYDDGLFPPLDSPTPGDPLATQAQAGLIRVRAEKAGLTEEQRHAITDAITGQPSSKLVPKRLVNAVLAEIDRAAAAQAGFAVPANRQETTA